MNIILNCLMNFIYSQPELALEATSVRFDIGTTTQRSNEIELCIFGIFYHF